MKRNVKMLQRMPDGTYEKVDPEPTMPRPSGSCESKWLRELAYYGNTVCRIKDRSRWAELRLVPAGTYTVGGEQITVSLTYIVVTKNKAFIQNFKGCIADGTIMQADNGFIIKQMIEKITIYSNYMEIECKCGAKIRQEYVK